MTEDSTKKDLIEKREAQLDTWHEAVGRLKESLQDVDEERREHLDERLEVLQRKLERNRQRLEEIRELSAKAWAEAQVGVHGSWDDVSHLIGDIERKIAHTSPERGAS